MDRYNVLHTIIEDIKRRRLMFYCNECAERNGWPESLFKSRGPCEGCGRTATCNEVSSDLLPPPPVRVVDDAG